MAGRKRGPRPSNVGRRDRGSKLQAQQTVLDALTEGFSIAIAARRAGRTSSTFWQWVRTDPAFKTRYDSLKVRRVSHGLHGVEVREHEPLPEFPVFCSEFLGQPLFEHQLRWWDVLEGREPRNLHPSMSFSPGWPNRLLMNVPPGHAKSTTVSINYVSWRIFDDPNVKIIIVSETQKLASQFLGAVKQRLVHPNFAVAQDRFGPVGGFRDPDGSWTQNQIYVKGKDDGEKDPTAQSVGIGGQIYGARADVIILDDVVTLASAGRIEDQINWLNQECLSRLPPEGGTVIIAGTRVAPDDMYRTLRDQTDEFTGERVWTYLAQPAVLEYADRPEDWVALWPYTTGPDGSRKEMWSGRRLARRRAELASSHRWALVYQQEDVSEDSVFPPGAVNASLNRMRAPGLLHGQLNGTNRPEGMVGLKVIAGLDPAAVGHTAMIVGAVDRVSGKRWLLDGWNHAAATPLEMRNKIKHFTEAYRVTEWVIERNAFQGYLTRDEELLQWLYARGCRVREHTTTGNKWDPDAGVSSLAPLFLSCGSPVEGSNTNWRRNAAGGLIDVPDPNRAPWVPQLVDQLVTWMPGQMKQRQKTDLVMALWMFDIGAREFVGMGQRQQLHYDTQYTSRRAKARRVTVNLNALEAEQLTAA